MSQDEGREWARAWTSNVGKMVQSLRKSQKLSAQELSERTRAMGYPLPRSTITNLENGRKETVSIHEVTVLAAALDCPPVVLLYPPTESAVDVLPDHPREPLEAILWFRGTWTLLDSPGPHWKHLPEHLGPRKEGDSDRIVWQLLHALTDHVRLVDKCWYAAIRLQSGLWEGMSPEDRELSRELAQNEYQLIADLLRMRRDQLSAAGWQLPQLPAELEWIDGRGEHSAEG